MVGVPLGTVTGSSRPQLYPAQPITCCQVFRTRRSRFNTMLLLDNALGRD